MKRYLPFLFLLFSSVCLQAQMATNEYVSGEILLQLSKAGTMEKVVYDLQTVNGKQTHISIAEELSDVMHIWHIRYNSSAISDADMLSAVKRNTHVREAQFNHYVTLRATTPNDPQYAQQWQYDNNGSNGGVLDADIDAPEAWDITTGGITADGDTIVVAIVDDGTNLNHPDLVGNLWKNYAEIPGNGIDDDGNGYIDDFDGWNSVSNNGTITGGSHGTCVSGIVGARGNNGIGVSGVNWNVKLMIIRGSSNTEATVVSAYSYALKMRKKYNQTNGAQGAFVVATNSSFGVDNGNPANFPLWCAMYDSMGVAGILNAGATANANSNVDVVGDIPTACSSDYLISVTNVGRNDAKVTSAGYGAITIDLGSFGQDTWTLTQTGYGAFGGTSGATPHVAGTIALIYSVPCPEFIQFAKSDPAAAALQVKQWILQSGDDNASLDGITVSGKRLNTFNAVSEVQNNCGACSLPGGVKATNIHTEDASIIWNTSNTATQYIVQYRQVGSNIWLEQFSPTPPLIINGLTPCTNYQFRVRSVCNSDSASGYTNTVIFKTDGCCEPPVVTTVSNLTQNQAEITWPIITAAVGYNFRYRTVGSSSWTNNNNLLNNINTLSGLTTCTQYEYQIATVCTSGITDYGNVYTFKTKGCGACEEQSYCASSAATDFVFIQKVQIGNIDNTSGNDNGYGDYIGGNYAWLMADSASGITLTPTFPVFSITGNWKIWVDWNQNGVFESSELALSTSGSSAVSGNITPPVSALNGITRMRVALAGLQDPVECGDSGFGETEDYCVKIKPRSFTNIKEASISSVSIFPNPANDVVNIQLSGEIYNKLELMDISGKVLKSISVKPHTEMLQFSTYELSNGMYLVQFSGNQGSIIQKLVIRK